MSTDLRAAVTAAERRLSEAGVPSPRADAVALAAHALGVEQSEVHRLTILGAPAPERLPDLVDERARRVPLQHLTGRAAFRRLELEVGPGVFVPRPETECVAGWAIEAASERLAAGRPPVVVDLCTGSGAIAFAVKDEVPQARVHAVEVSELAHGWADRNRERLGLDVDLVLGDATTSFPDLEGEVDVVVANPPYIPSGAEPIDPEVRDHDPRLALYGGSEDGLAIPRLVAARASSLLRHGGVLVMEHGDGQGESLPRALLATGSWSHVEDRDDLTGRPRAAYAIRG